FLLDNTTPSGVNRNVGSSIRNNVVYGSASAPLVWIELAAPQGGVTIDNNLYFSVGATPFRAGTDTQQNFAFAAWRKLVAAEGASLDTDPLLTDVSRLLGSGTSAYDYDGARPTAQSPLIGHGVSLAPTFTDNVELVPRASWNIGAF